MGNTTEPIESKDSKEITTRTKGEHKITDASKKQNILSHTLPSTMNHNPYVIESELSL